MTGKVGRMSRLIGLTGFARCGKDTFFLRSSRYLHHLGVKSNRFAFADVLKGECDPLLRLNTGISAFTHNAEEKEIIRPLLVTYGTNIRRKLDPNCWIDQIKAEVSEKLSCGHYVFITDVRFYNEAEWIKSEGGSIFNIQRDGIGAANTDELEQSKLIRFLVDVKISWPTFGEEDLSECDYYVESSLQLNNEKFFQRNGVA